MAHFSIIIESMKTMTSQMKAVVKLHNNPSPIFLTWPVEKFGSYWERKVKFISRIRNDCYNVFSGDEFELISSAYAKEYEIKVCTKENIAHCTSEDKLLIHLAAWIYQVFISPKVTVALESLLIETGHR